MSAQLTHDLRYFTPLDYDTSQRQEREINDQEQRIIDLETQLEEEIVRRRACFVALNGVYKTRHKGGDAIYEIVKKFDRELCNEHNIRHATGDPV